MHLKLSKLVGNKGLVIAIEPDPENVKILQKVTSKRKNVLIVDKGLWSSKNSMPLYIHEYDYAHSFIKDMVSGPARGKTLEVDSLDNILANLKIQNVNFIKMNIEGAEIEALKGAKTTLTNNRVSLAIEAHHMVNGQPTNKTIAPMLTNQNFIVEVSDVGVVYATKC